MTDKYVSFMLFTNCHIIDGVYGVDFDQPLCRNFSLNVNTRIVFEQFLRIVGFSFGVDMSSN